MFTVCPKCTLTLVVTTVDLRAGQGYVRCGRCANVFNALIALREGEPGGTTSDTAKRRLLETEPKPSVEPAVGSGVAMDPEPEKSEQPEPPEASEIPEVPGEGSLEFDASATDVSEIFIPPPVSEHDTGSGNYEAVVLGEGPPREPEPELDVPDFSPTDTIASDDWSLLDDTPADAESSIEESPLAQSGTADPAWVHEMFAEAEADAERARTAEREGFAFDAPRDDTAESPHDEPEASSVDEFAVEPTDEQAGETGASEDLSEPIDSEPSDAALDPLLNPPVTRRSRWQYVSGIVLLALLLTLQLLHHNRQSLALNTTFGPAAAKVYGWMGMTLLPRWDLSAYSVKQLGAAAEGSDGTQLRVRLSVQNDSSRVQPLPLLRLTLQDRFGNAVATRDLEPAEYLPERIAGQRLLEPDQRIDAELHVIDPGKAAIGFEIDACLRAETGAIGCANEARRRAAG